MSKLLGASDSPSSKTSAFNGPSSTSQKHTSGFSSKAAGSGGGTTGAGVWSALLNNVSSGLNNDDLNSFSHVVDNHDEDGEGGHHSMANGDISSHEGGGYENEVADGDGEGGGKSGSRTKSKHILVIGESGCGKTTLLSLLRGAADKSQKGNKQLMKSGYALDYYYMDIESEEFDIHEESRKCSIWVMRSGGSTGVQSLLHSTYTAQMVPHTLFTIVLDFSQPWKLKQNLQSGIESIKSIIAKLEVSPDVITSMSKKLERRFQLYCDNETDAKLMSSSTTTGGGGGASATEELLPLSSGVLTENIGVPIMVICTKLDCIPELEKSYKYNDEYFDYIQQFLRIECLKYGASLAYYSNKDARYNQCLYKLILNSLYHVLPKSGSLASVVEKDSIVIPIGWDGLHKIKSVQDNLIGDIHTDDPFEQVCPQPTHVVNKRSPNLKDTVSGTPLLADEEQVFLSRSQSTLQKPVQTGTSSLSMRGGTQSVSGATGGGNRSLAAGGGATSNTEPNLQQFFNSLLNTKTKGTPSASGASASGLSSPLKGSPMDPRRMTAPPRPTPTVPNTPPVNNNPPPPLQPRLNLSHPLRPPFSHLFFPSHPIKLISQFQQR